MTLGWSAVRFAGVVGISRFYLCNIEAGRRNGTPELLQDMAEVLGVPVSEIAAEQKAS